MTVAAAASDDDDDDDDDDDYGAMSWRPSLALRNDHASAVKSVALRGARGDDDDDDDDGEGGGDGGRLTLVSASADGEIRVRVTTSGDDDDDAGGETWRPLARLRGHDGSVKAVRAVGARCDRVLSASYDRSARLWTLPPASTTDEAPGRREAPPPRAFRGHGDYVVDAAFTDDDTFGELVVTASSDGFIRVWGAGRGEVLETDDVRYGGAATCVDVYSETDAVDSNARNDCVIVSGSVDGSIRFYHVQSGSCALVLLGHLGAVTGVAVPDDAEDSMTASTRASTVSHTRVGYGCKNGVIGVFALYSETDEEIGESIRMKYLMRTRPSHPDAGEYEGVTCAKFMRSSSATILASSSEDRTVRIWDVHRGSCLHILTGQVPACIECVSMTSSTLACGGSDGSVFVWRKRCGVGDVAMTNAHRHDAKTLTTRADIAIRWLLRKGPYIAFHKHDPEGDPLVAAAYDAADGEARALVAVDPAAFAHGEVCTICHESLLVAVVEADDDADAAKSTVIQLSCRHCFHASCAYSWMHVSHQCPNCREVNYDSGLPHVMACVDIDRHRPHAVVRA